jgi:hypothetical protein
MLGAVPHTYNPRYWAWGAVGQRSVKSQFEASKKLAGCGLMHLSCYPSYTGVIIKRITVHALPGNNVRPYLKK